MRPKIKLRVLAFVIIAFFSFLIFKAVDSSLVYYLTVNEVLEKNRNFPKYKQLRVLGVVKEGSIINNMDGSIIFVIEEDGSSMIVEYKGIIPDIFDDGVEAVVEGDFRGSTFKAEKLFAKCPTKYEDADYEKEKS
tara:strand:+ start:116951 stop:117355 length:405 start_codon:yes stop_codon:yes gene_type:complete